MMEKQMSAGQLLTLPGSFEIQFARGQWVKIHSVMDGAGFGKQRKDLPRIGLYDKKGRLITWYYKTTLVRVRGFENGTR